MRLISKSLRSLLNLRLGGQITEAYRFLDRSQWFSRRELDDLQAELYRNLMEVCLAQVPFYRRYAAESGLEPDQLKDLAQISRLPVLDKRRIKENPQDFQTEGFKGGFVTAATSGATGIPLQYLMSNRAMSWTLGASYRGLSWYGVKPWDHQARFWGVALTPRAQLLEKGKDMLLNRRRFSAFDISPAGLRTSYQRLIRYDPVYIYAYPSALWELAKWMQENNQTYPRDKRLKLIVSTAEYLYGFQREAIRSAFQVPVVNEYGASELALLAYECPAGSLHLHEELVHAEFVSTDIDLGGESGTEIIVTALLNQAMPFIRYNLGDLVKPLEGICSCGRQHRRLAIQQGRSSDVVQLPGGGRLHAQFSAI